MQIGFKNIGTLKTDMLHQLRASQQAALSVEVAAHKKRLEDILCSNARASKMSGHNDNPLVSALGRAKGNITPMTLFGTADSKLFTIQENPVEMYDGDM